jgi:ATP-dependent Clp protease ATP-binding subunit ClpA
MAPSPVSLDHLIAYIRALHPDGDPLERLADAVTAALQLDEQSDAVIGYFVDQARSSGASWSQIGAAMGVSKQAAQKRFVARVDELAPEGKAFSRFTPRARVAVAAAGEQARRAGEEQEVDATHLVVGAIQDPDGLAAAAIRRLEIGPDRIFAVIGTGPTTEEGDSDPVALRQLRFTESGRDALKEALKTALRLGHNYIGTEHLLLGAAAAGGDLAARLAEIGLQRPVLESAVSVELAEAQFRRRRQTG